MLQHEKEVASSQKNGETSSGAAESKNEGIYDWVMADVDEPKSRPNPAVKAEQRETLKKVNEERQALMNRLTELDVQHSELSDKVKGQECI